MADSCRGGCASTAVKSINGVLSNMGYQWGRFIWWLGQNSAAVQALAAVVTVLLTGVLIFVTIRYVLLTRKLVEASEASIRAGFMPDINANIDFTHPRKDELSIYVKNTAEAPICILRAKLIGGSLFKWPETANPPNEYAAELKFGPSDITSLTSLFLRKNEEARGVFRITPIEHIDDADWLKAINYRVSLTATVIIEVSDITGRILYSFTVLRDAETANTRIRTQFPSSFDKT